MKDLVEGGTDCSCCQTQHVVHYGNIYPIAYFFRPEGLFLNVRISSAHRGLIITAFSACFVMIAVGP
jgi:hypothetical protein